MADDWCIWDDSVPTLVSGAEGLMSMHGAEGVR